MAIQTTNLGSEVSGEHILFHSKSYSYTEMILHVHSYSYNIYVEHESLYHIATMKQKNFMFGIIQRYLQNTLVG